MTWLLAIAVLSVVLVAYVVGWEMGYGVGRRYAYLDGYRAGARAPSDPSVWTAFVEQTIEGSDGPEPTEWRETKAEAPAPVANEHAPEE